MIELLFWPAILFSILVSIIGISIRKPVLLIISAVLTLPFAWYFTQTPRFHYFGYFLPFFQICGAVALHKKSSWLTWLLLLSIIVFYGWLAMVILRQ